MYTLAASPRSLTSRQRVSREAAQLRARIPTSPARPAPATTSPIPAIHRLRYRWPPVTPRHVSSRGCLRIYPLLRPDFYFPRPVLQVSVLASRTMQVCLQLAETTDEPRYNDNTRLAPQHSDVDGAQCAVVRPCDFIAGLKVIPTDLSSVLTSTRTAFYKRLPYVRGSAPSICYTTQVTAQAGTCRLGEHVPALPPKITPARAALHGPFGLVESIP